MARTDPALARHVADLWPDLEHLFEVGDQAKTLDGHQGWSAVRSVLQAEIDAINATMERAHGPLEQAEYAVRHGRIGGLKSAQGAVDAIVETAERRRSEQAAKHEAGAESPAEG